jgi:hypothetical protein
MKRIEPIPHSDNIQVEFTAVQTPPKRLKEIHFLFIECEQAVGSTLLYDLQETYFTNHRHLHMTGFLPHAVHLTYKEFLLVSYSLSPRI